MWSVSLPGPVDQQRFGGRTISGSQIENCDLNLSPSPIDLWVKRNTKEKCRRVCTFRAYSVWFYIEDCLCVVVNGSERNEMNNKMLI